MFGCSELLFQAYFVHTTIQIKNALNKRFVSGNVILLQFVHNLFNLVLI